MKIWREEATALWAQLESALDGGEQIKLIAEALQRVYEYGIGEGITMEQGIAHEHYHTTKTSL